MRGKNRQRPTFKRRFIFPIALIGISMALFLITQNQVWITLFVLSLGIIVFSASRGGRFYWGLPYPKYVDYLVYLDFFGDILMILSVILSVVLLGYEQTRMNLFFKNPPFSYIWIAGFFLISIPWILADHARSSLNKKVEEAVPKVPEEEVKEATSVTLATTANVRRISEKFEEIAKRHLIKQKSVLLKGYVTLLKYTGRAGDKEPYMVVETDPNGHVKVTEKTVVKVLEEPYFTCPSCGSPYWDVIPVEAIHVKCENCRKKVPIPDHVTEKLKERWEKYDFLRK